ncbi:MAG: polysaccharide deacetylase family protein, partial [Planctomycetota bacterium]
EFEAQLVFLKERCEVVSPATVAAAVVEERVLPPNAVAITFDDGYEDNFSVAFPLLKKHGLVAGFFITAGWVETMRVLWWDRLHEYVREASREGVEPVGWERLPEPVGAALAGANLTDPVAVAALYRELVTALRAMDLPADEIDALVERVAVVLGVGEAPVEPYLPMNWLQVQILRDGGMEIGSHTLSHARLTTLAADDAYDELDQSKHLLESKLGQPVDLLAYPAGAHNQDVMDLAAEAGYEAAFTTEVGPVRPGDDGFALRRIGVWSGGYRGAVSDFSAPVFGLQIGRLARRE